FVKQPQMVARAQIGDARRRRVVPSHAFVPDACGWDHQSLEARTTRAKAPIDLFAVDEELGVEGSNVVHHRHPHEDGAATDPVRFERLRVLTGIELVLPSVMGSPIRRRRPPGRLNDVRRAVVIDEWPEGPRLGLLLGRGHKMTDYTRGRTRVS